MYSVLITDGKIITEWINTDNEKEAKNAEMDVKQSSVVKNTLIVQAKNKVKLQNYYLDFFGNGRVQIMKYRGNF